MKPNSYNITMQKPRTRIYEQDKVKELVYVALHHFKREGTRLKRVGGKTRTVYNVDFKKLDGIILKALEKLEREG